MAKNKKQDTSNFEDRLLEKAQAHVADLLTMHWREIMAAMDEKQEVAGEEEQVKMHVALGVDVAPRKGLARVSAAISFGVRTKDSSESEVVSETPELPFVKEA